MNDVVEMALAQAPEDRYLTAQDFVNDIQRTFQDAEVGQMDSKPIITPLGWGLALAAVVFIGLIVFNLKPDPVKEAEAADSRVRAEVFERHDRPSTAERQQITSRHPQNMILIPAGPFVRGRLHSERRDVAPASEPLAQVVEMDAYLIDAFEFGNLKGAAPKYNVTYGEAERFCSEAGKRICTANEWEKACKGPKNNVYSYGDTFDQEFCGMGLDAQYKSGTRPDCKSGWGVFDISGNFREWTSSEPKPGRRIVRGGIRSNPVKGSRCALATDESAMYRDRSLAFRCCRDVDAPPVK